MSNKLFILIVILLFSCTNPFAPKLVNQSLLTSSFLTEQKSPQDVLTNFRYAYIFKDSLIYSEIIDSSFIFTYINYSTTPIIPVSWGRDDDLRTTAKLFRHFRDIKLTWGNVLYSTIKDDQAEIKLTFTLTFEDGTEIPTLKGEAIFNFVRKKTGKWTIIRWQDEGSF